MTDDTTYTMRVDDWLVAVTPPNEHGKTELLLIQGTAKNIERMVSVPLTEKELEDFIHLCNKRLDNIRSSHDPS